MIIIIILIVTTMMIVIAHLAILSAGLSHHEADLLLRQQLPQGGHRGGKVFMVIAMMIRDHDHDNHNVITAMI